MRQNTIWHRNTYLPKKITGRLLHEEEKHTYRDKDGEEGMQHLSGPGRVDMLTSPVAAARAAVATGAWVKSKHDMKYLIRESVGA